MLEKAYIMRTAKLYYLGFTKDFRILTEIESGCCREINSLNLLKKI